ncbi:MAG: site-specific integrase, partial [Acidimicrobiaceae bacterium]|nr:site-specific integrase [Acidimicrobiaceae bacterium]
MATKKRPKRSTIKTYEQAWQRYSTWCESEGHDPLDADPATVVAFVNAMNDRGLKMSTIRLTCASVTHFHKRHGLADPTKHEPVRDALAWAQEDADADESRAETSATPLTKDLLERVLAVSAIPRSCESPAHAATRHAEMSAVLRLMFDSALRCDEASRARWSWLGEPDDMGRRDLRIPASKTGKRTGHVSRRTAEALDRWRATSPDPDGRITTAPTTTALAARIKRLGQRAGVELSGHSARHGVLTSCAEN